MTTAGKMRPILRSLLMGLVLLPVLAGAEKDKEDEFDVVISGGQPSGGDVVYGEVVDKVYAPRINSWRVLDDQRIVLYATPFKPYLITLNRRASGLRFDDRITIKRSGSTLHSRFDSIIVDGFPYSIKRIEKLDRETAKSLLAKDPDKKRDGSEAEEPSKAEATSDS